MSIPSLDATDLRLLDLLQNDASLSNLQLAERAHTSPATALRRVRRLIDEGVIERQVALLSPDQLGHGLSALVEITLDRQGAEHLDAFETRIAQDSAVQQQRRAAVLAGLARTGLHPRRACRGYAGLSRTGAALVHPGRQRAQREGLLQRQTRQV